LTEVRGKADAVAVVTRLPPERFHSSIHRMIVRNGSMIREKAATSESEQLP
jgi:hypothetical protein